jgi:hypothetical protein
MAAKSLLLGAFALNLTLGALPAFAEVAFRADRFETTAVIGSRIVIHLKDFLVDGSLEGLSWTTRGGQPGWLSLDAANAELVGTPTCETDAAYHIKLVVIEPGVNTDSASIELGVTKGSNCTPIWYNGSELGEYELTPDEPVTLTFSRASVANWAYDPDGDPITISFVGNPSWLTMTPAEDGDLIYFTGRPTKEELFEGGNIIIRASDGQSHIDGTIYLTLYIP